MHVCVGVRESERMCVCVCGDGGIYACVPVSVCPEMFKFVCKTLQSTHINIDVVSETRPR